MYYVYLLKSLNFPDQVYIGYTANLKNRLAVHNVGGSPHTSKYKLWELVMYFGFGSQGKALEFEKYLKSRPRREFAAKRLW